MHRVDDRRYRLLRRLLEAWALALGEAVKELHRTSRAFMATYRRGREAAKLGKPRQSPYADLRGGRFGQVTTWSRAFMGYWYDGYDDEKAGKPDRYCTVGKCR